MGLEASAIAAIVAATASAVGTGASIHQGQMQLKSQKHAFNQQRRAEEEQRQAATNEAMAQKRALIAEQESMSASVEEKKKKTFAKQGGSYQASGTGWGLGTDDGKLG